MRLKGVGLAMLLVLAMPASAQDAKVPYWASISSGEAMMRSGPGRTYPGTWLYKRRDLPVRVLQRYDNWRKVEDPDGTTGWIAVALLSERRTGMVRGETNADLHLEADPASPVRYRAEPGVVGRLAECNGEMCRIKIGEKEGWVSQSALWGVDANEAFDD